jgi:hypothetical protein
MIQIRTMLDQNLQQFVLHSGPLRVNARGRQPQRRASTVQIRLGIHLCARRQQNPRHVHDIRRSFLSLLLHSVRPNIIQQRSVMLALRPRPHQLRLVCQKAHKRPDVAANNRIHGHLNPRIHHVQFLKCAFSSMRAQAQNCHPDRSKPAFSYARFLRAGSRSGGTWLDFRPTLLNEMAETAPGCRTRSP